LFFRGTIFLYVRNIVNGPLLHISVATHRGTAMEGVDSLWPTKDSWKSPVDAVASQM